MRHYHGRTISGRRDLPPQELRLIEWKIRCACACGLTCCKKSPCGFSAVIAASSASAAIRIARGTHQQCRGVLRCEGPLHGIPKGR